MNARIARMLTHIPTGADTAAQSVPSLALTGTGTVALNNLTLYVTNTASNAAAAIDLHNTQVSALPAQLPSGITATVLQDGPAELLQLANDAAALPATLTIATNPLWQVLGVLSRAVETATRSDQQWAAQVNVRGATGLALDEWAATLGIARHAGEPDSLFIQRLVGQTLNPAVNNAAIVALLTRLGYPATVTDIGPWQFQADIQFPTYQPSGFAYTQAQLAAIIGDVKALGVQALVRFLNAILDTASVSEAVTTTTTADSAIGWGSVDWGQFAWV